MALIKCGECGREVSDKAASCPGCGAPILGSFSAEPAPAPKAKKGTQNVGCVGVLAILVGALILYSAIFSDDTSKTATAPASRTVSQPAVGDDARLVVSSGKVLVAVDEAAYGRFVQLSVAEDYAGMAEMVASGRLLSVDSGTRAKVIGQAFERREVRVMDGPHAGRSGWVTSSLVVR